MKLVILTEASKSLEQQSKDLQKQIEDMDKKLEAAKGIVMVKQLIKKKVELIKLKVKIDNAIKSGKTSSDLKSQAKKDNEKIKTLKDKKGQLYTEDSGVPSSIKFYGWPAKYTDIDTIDSSYPQIHDDYASVSAKDEVDFDLYFSEDIKTTVKNLRKAADFLESKTLYTIRMSS